MTKGQEIIVKYLRTQFVGVRYTADGSDVIVVHDRTGNSMKFTVNLYGDIMDYDTRQVIAKSNLPHDLAALDMGAEPISWENQRSYFG